MAILSECPTCKARQSLKNKRCKCGEDLDRAKRSGRVRYWITYRLPGGTQRKEMVGTSIEEARDADGKRRGQKREGRIFDMLPDSKITFSQLAEWYFELESVNALKSIDTIRVYVNKFLGVYGDMPVSDIRPADLENLQARRRREGLKEKTIDDELNYSKTMIIKAFDNGKVGGDPLRVFRRVKKLLKGHANARDRAISADEFSRLVGECPRHLKDILTIAYWTGMRKGEITALTWDKIDMKGRMIRLEAADTKEGKAKSVPMATIVYEVLKAIVRALHDSHVFMYYGKPITRNFSQGLKSACKKAGIEWGRDVKGGFIFHDLRHSFITDMRRAGVDRTVRMAITGHAIRDMDQRYDVVEDSDKLVAIRQLEVYRAGSADVAKVLPGAAV
ncbi:MAG: site-specific integrase [Desulfobacteraceae bacterium]|nr:MAG: site-specific integrase [Desulfobacteraceae bacterium]